MMEHTTALDALARGGVYQGTYSRGTLYVMPDGTYLIGTN